MGEPLLYRHFDQIIQLCHEFNVKLNLTTNGTFPKYGAVEWAKKIVPIGSDVKISWNGATKQTSELIMIGSNFEKRVQNVKEFIRSLEMKSLRAGKFLPGDFSIDFHRAGP